MRASACCSWAVCRPSKKCLDDSNIGSTLEQMGGKGVAKRMQRHALLDPGPIGRLVEQPVELAGGHRHAGLAPRKQPAFLKGCRVCIETSTRLPPLPQQINHLRREHDIAILAALGLLDTNDLLRAVDVLDLQPDHFAGTQAATAAKAERHAGLEARGNGQHAPRLVRAHHLRNLLGLADVIDLGRKIQPPQRHAEQEPQPGHDAVAIADARTRLGKMQLEPADILRRGGVGRPLEKRGELLAAADVASLRARTEPARVHVLGHALTQRADRVHTHGQLLSWMRLTTPRSSRQGTRPATDDPPRVEPYRCAPRSPPRAIAQRFSALARLGPGAVLNPSPLSGGQRTSTNDDPGTRWLGGSGARVIIWF